MSTRRCRPIRPERAYPCRSWGSPIAVSITPNQRTAVRVSIAFVRRRRMREKGVDLATARFLLSGLPDTFDEWKATPETCQSTRRASWRRRRARAPLERRRGRQKGDLEWISFGGSIGRYLIGDAGISAVKPSTLAVSRQAGHQAAGAERIFKFMSRLLTCCGAGAVNRGMGACPARRI
jgi:hypothetical protein